MIEDDDAGRALSRWFWVAVLFVGCRLTGGFLFSLWMAAKIARRLLG